MNFFRRLSNLCRDIFTQMGSAYMQDLRYRDVWFFIGALTPNVSLVHPGQGQGHGPVHDLELDALSNNETTTTDFGFTPFEEVIPALLFVYLVFTFHA